MLTNVPPKHLSYSLGMTEAHEMHDSSPNPHKYLSEIEAC